MSSGVPWIAVARPVRLASGQPEPDRMPEAGLDRDHRAAGAQQPGRLGEAGGERALVGDVVQHEPVEDDVERRRREVETAGVAQVDLVGAVEARDACHSLGIGVDGDQPEGGRREQMAAGMPARPDRQHVAGGDARGERRGAVARGRSDGGSGPRASTPGSGGRAGCRDRAARARIWILGDRHAGSPGALGQEGELAAEQELGRVERRGVRLERAAAARSGPGSAAILGPTSGESSGGRRPGATRSASSPSMPGPQLDRAEVRVLQERDESYGRVVPQAERVVGLELRGRAGEPCRPGASTRRTSASSGSGSRTCSSTCLQYTRSKRAVLERHRHPVEGLEVGVATGALARLGRAGDVDPDPLHVRIAGAKHVDRAAGAAARGRALATDPARAGRSRARRSGRRASGARDRRARRRRAAPSGRDRAASGIEPPTPLAA